ncbi:ADP-ribosylglycohydrolase family protein [Taibaiella koreensis]|uniref:ADP-ribosylglycohydrolase family protein n=1 Tax=Taibaiella koreensis TaxID=1268548 RepID=UPI0013C2A025|nr:ADP-ribosylglycohydrolase family protein [Taibaiella koreensis]
MATSDDRLKLAARSLSGTAIGDAFGECFFGAQEQMLDHIQNKHLPLERLMFTDDTIMAIALFRSLEAFGTIDKDYVLGCFLQNYQIDTHRGYGPSMHHFFREVAAGADGKKVAAEKFEGMGSMGNGSAMRAALIGAYFYDNLALVKLQTAASSIITHTNIEAVAGAIAVATAAALATRQQEMGERYSRNTFLNEIIEALPQSDTRSQIGKARAMEGSYSIPTLVAALGNGTRMLAQDTVPLALWCAAKHLNDFEACLWELVSALGDRDTLCAIAGGIVALSAPETTIPLSWQHQVESWKESDFYKQPLRSWKQNN